MDIFIRNIPLHANKRDIEAFFQRPLARFRIDTYHTEKIRNKPLAIITVKNAEDAKAFLELYGIPANASHFNKPKEKLFWGGRPMLCSQSRNEPCELSKRSLAYETTQKETKQSDSTRQHQAGRPANFGVQQTMCGTWDYIRTDLVFFAHFEDKRQGSIIFGHGALAIVLGGAESDQTRIDISYDQCHNIVMSSDRANPSLTISLRSAPKFYQVAGMDMLSAFLMATTLGKTPLKPQQKMKKARVTGIDDAHAKIAGTFFVYRVVLADHQGLKTVRSLLSTNTKAPSPIGLSTKVMQGAHGGLKRLLHEITDQRGYGSLPFKLLYQIQRLGTYGILSPEKVVDLLPKIAQIHKSRGLDCISSVLRRFIREVVPPGPGVYSSEVSTTAREQHLENLVEAYGQRSYNPEDPYQLVKRHSHIILVHKAVVTPTTLFLEGPEPESTNRVLRKYSDHTDNFIRVVFQDEDGGSVRYDPQATQEEIFHDRFKKVLDGSIQVLVAGKAFEFLGFSHSSLRAQSCWFMAPIVTSDGGLIRAADILKTLGDFSKIRVPAKCAARIGQNFTDTNPSIDLTRDMVDELQVVERNGRDFSDGVGTISESLIRKVWLVYGQRRNLKPTALQIRFQGAKGMVSLDSRLRGDQLMLRSNMRKFETETEWNLEICGASFRPLPMIMNRQLIKVLEDLGVPESSFEDLQNTAVDRLRYMTQSFVDAAAFLEDLDITRATQIPDLIRQLGLIGMDFHEDAFLFGVVEMGVIQKLRDIKYRGRIPVESGVTLYGILDETGYLQEGEVYVVTERGPEGGRQELIRDRVIITRAPVIHPGDVQCVNAVDVPPDSPLKRLSNIVAFSQWGARDLPSQLSGGDLDGDIYNVVWDPSLIPPKSYPPADYPRVAAASLGRDVTAKDMSDFFVTFMETDVLGMICNIHLQLADQKAKGTFDEDCIQLAGLASDAVDYSKTGVGVDMSRCPQYPKFRPDFMAPSPRVAVSAPGLLELVQEDENSDPAFEGLDVERRGYRYYESEKVLGSLYRAIDERQFLATMQNERRAFMAVAGGRMSFMQSLLEYMKQQASKYGIAYLHHLDLARDIRLCYEENLCEILYSNSPVPNQPVSEHEAFAGAILGRKGGAQGKTLREASKTMRENFGAVVDWVRARIVKGDEQMRGVSDLELYGDDIEREVEALPRAIACLDIAVKEPAMISDHQLGQMQSFKYIAAGVCLRELERFQETTLGLTSLPRLF